MVFLIFIVGLIFFIPILYVLLKFLSFICFEKDEFWDEIVKKKKWENGSFRERFPKVALSNYNANANLPKATETDEALTMQESRNMIHFVFLVNGYMGVWKVRHKWMLLCFF